MSKTIEYRVIPHTHFMVVRFEREDDGGWRSGSSTQRGEFHNEEEANEVATLLAKAESGAKFISSMKRPVRGPIAGGGLSAS